MKTLQFKQKSKTKLSPLAIGFIVSCVLHLSLLAMLIQTDLRKISIKTNNTISINLSNVVAPNIGNQIEQPTPKIQQRQKQHKKIKEKPKEHTREKITLQEEVIEEITQTQEAETNNAADNENTEEVISNKASIAGGGGSQAYLNEDSLLFLMIKNSIDKYNQYPKIARKRIIEGDVIIEFIIFKNGTVDKINIIKGAHNILNESAINAIKKASKEFPNMEQDTRIKITISYNLNKP